MGQCTGQYTPHMAEAQYIQPQGGVRRCCVVLCPLFALFRQMHVTILKVMCLAWAFCAVALAWSLDRIRTAMRV